MTKTNAPSQPSVEDERTLEHIVDNGMDYTFIRGRRVGFRFVNGFVLHKISRLMTEEGSGELHVSCKCVAAARLHGYFRLKFLWPLLWRWYAYVRQYDDADLMAAVELIKKKAAAALTAYLINTTSLTAIRETAMKMTRAEARATLQGLSGGKGGR